MTPVETVHLATFVAAKYPSAHVRESSPRSWHAVLAGVDAIDALMAVIRLAHRQRKIALDAIHIEACRIRKERLTRNPDLDADLNGLHHYRTDLLAVVISMLTQQVRCPWCGAARGQTCTLPGSGAPLRKTPAHPARLIAVGLTGMENVDWDRLERSAYRG
jgi:hypothetical protein